MKSRAGTHAQFQHLTSSPAARKSISLRRGLFLLILAGACNQDIVIATLDPEPDAGQDAGQVAAGGMGGNLAGGRAGFEDAAWGIFDAAQDAGKIDGQDAGRDACAGVPDGRPPAGCPTACFDGRCLTPEEYACINPGQVFGGVRATYNDGTACNHPFTNGWCIDGVCVPR